MTTTVERPLIEKQFYTPQEVAEIWEVSLKTVYNHIQDGKISVRRVGRQYRIPRSAVDAVPSIEGAA